MTSPGRRTEERKRQRDKIYYPELCCSPVALLQWTNFCVLKIFMLGFCFGWLSENLNSHLKSCKEQQQLKEVIVQGHERAAEQIKVNSLMTEADVRVPKLFWTSCSWSRVVSPSSSHLIPRPLYGDWKVLSVDQARSSGGSANFRQPVRLCKNQQFLWSLCSLYYWPSVCGFPSCWP